jgi:hypothetical protein
MTRLKGEITRSDLKRKWPHHAIADVPVVSPRPEPSRASPAGQRGGKIDRSGQNGSAVNWLYKHVRRALRHFYVNSLLREYHDEKAKRD